jgi:hypothetical protein
MQAKIIKGIIISCAVDVLHASKFAEIWAR